MDLLQGMGECGYNKDSNMYDCKPIDGVPIEIAKVEVNGIDYDLQCLNNPAKKGCQSPQCIPNGDGRCALDVELITEQRKEQRKADEKAGDQRTKDRLAFMETVRANVVAAKQKEKKEIEQRKIEEAIRNIEKEFGLVHHFYWVLSLFKSSRSYEAIKVIADVKKGAIKPEDALRVAIRKADAKYLNRKYAPALLTEKLRH
ncbi:MAG: hypothetical protein LE168_00320 [Endomicrobium sp.]|nr:hypothetical protein [Endomicrobium sp.]